MCELVLEFQTALELDPELKDDLNILYMAKVAAASIRWVAVKTAFNDPADPEYGKLRRLVREKRAQRPPSKAPHKTFVMDCMAPLMGFVDEDPQWRRYFDSQIAIGDSINALMQIFGQGILCLVPYTMYVRAVTNATVT